MGAVFGGQVWRAWGESLRLRLVGLSVVRLDGEVTGCQIGGGYLG